MNAISTPIAAPVAEPPIKRTIAPAKGNAFGTDAIYKGYDMIVRKCATHIIRPALVTTRSRADLVRAIGSPAVSFAASAADGSILITCPDGLPEILLDLAEPLELDHDPLGQKLDLLDRKLDALIQDQPGIDHLSDRLSAVEFALREGLDQSAQTQQFDRINNRIDAVVRAVAEFPPPLSPDLTPVLDDLRRVEGKLDSLDFTPFETRLLDLDQAFGQTAHMTDQSLAAIASQISALAERPQPVLDLDDQNRSLTAIAATLTDLAGHLDLLSQITNAGPDFSYLTAQFDALMSTLAPAAAVTEVRQQLDHLTQITKAGPDLTGQLQTLVTAIGQTAQDATLTEVKAQLDTLTRMTGQGPDLADLTAQYDTLMARLVQSDPGPALHEVTQQLDRLAQIATTGPDFTDLIARNDALQNTLDQTAQSAALQEVRLQLDQLTRITMQGPDLTGLMLVQTDHGFLLNEVKVQLDQLTEITAAGPDLSNLIAQQDAVLSRLDQTATLTEVKLDQLTQIAAAGPDLSNLIARQDAVLSRLDQTAAQTEVKLDQLTQIAAQGPDFSGITSQYDSVLTKLDWTARHAELTEVKLQLDQLTAQGPNLTAQFDAVLAKVGETAQAAALRDVKVLIDDLTQTATQVPDLIARLAAQIAALGDPTQSADLAQTMATVTDQIAQLGSGPDPMPQIVAQLSALSDGLTGLAASQATGCQIAEQFDAVLMTLGQPAQGRAVAEAMSHLAAQINVLTDRREPEAALTDIAQTLTTRLDAIAESLDAAPDLGVITTGFDTVLTAIGHPAQTAQVALAATQITDRIDRIAPPDMTGLAAQIEAGFSHIGQPMPHEVLKNALADLGEQISVVAQRPDPVIDLTAQHQSFARFGTALGQAVQRLETVAAAMTATDLTPILSEFDRLRADLPDAYAKTSQAIEHLATRIETLPQDPPDLSAILDRLQMFEAALVTAMPGDHGPAMADGFASLSTQMSDLATGQQGQGSFMQIVGTALTDAVLRLEDMAQMMAAMDQTEVSRRITALQADLVSRGQHLSGQLALLIDRPDTAADIAAQKQHLGDFATGLAELVQWLEPLTQGLTTGTDFGPIHVEFAQLRAELDLSRRDADLTQAFAHLSDQIADLIKSPDGVVSLAEQRRSFASFSNALAFMLQRLDAMVIQGTARAEDAPAAPLPLHDLATTLSTLVLRLEFLLNRTGTEDPVAQTQPDVVHAPDPALLIQDLATATTALAELVDLLEGGGTPDLSPAANASVAQLFDRLDRALMARDPADAIDADLTAAMANLSLALHGTPMAHADAVLRDLRSDFAELVARALRVQTEAA